MKVTLSIPDQLFKAAEMLSKRLKVSRSGLYTTALEEFVTKHDNARVTERLNVVYGVEDSRLDDTMRRLQARTLIRESW